MVSLDSPDDSIANDSLLQTGFFQALIRREVSELWLMVRASQPAPLRKLMKAGFSEGFSGWRGFKYVIFSPRTLGEMIQFDEHIFQMG